MKYKKRTSPPSAWTLQGKSAQFGWGPSPCKNTGQQIFRELPVCQHDHLLLTWGRSWQPSAGPSRQDSCKPPPPSPWWHPPPSFMLTCWWWSMSMTRPDVVLPEKLVAIRVKYFESPLCPDGWRGSNAVQEKNFIYCCYAPSCADGSFLCCEYMEIFNSLAWISLCISTYPWMVDQQRMMGANEKVDMVIGQTK